MFSLSFACKVSLPGIQRYTGLGMTCKLGIVHSFKSLNQTPVKMSTTLKLVSGNLLFAVPQLLDNIINPEQASTTHGITDNGLFLHHD